VKASRSLHLALLLAATALSGCAATADAVRSNYQADLAADHALAATPKADPAFTRRTGRDGYSQVRTSYTQPEMTSPSHEQSALLAVTRTVFFRACR